MSDCWVNLTREDIPGLGMAWYAARLANHEKTYKVFLNLTNNTYSDLIRCMPRLFDTPLHAHLRCDMIDGKQFINDKYLSSGMHNIVQHWMSFIIDVCVSSLLFLTGLTGMSFL